MTGQRMSQLYAGNQGDIYQFSHTEQVFNQDTFATISLVSGAVEGNDYWFVGCGISQIISDSGVEALDRPYAFRRNVTSVTFDVSGYQSQSVAVWSLNFWS